MIHAIRFCAADTLSDWTDTLADWGLALQTQPTFAMPPLKTHILEIPGGDGQIDLSTAITGYPVYGNRTGSFTFVAPVRQAAWQALISRIAEYLHGRMRRAVLDDDPGWFYEGRFTLDYDRCEEQYGTIVVNYSVGPYKWALRTTLEPWLWDPFSFVNGVIGNSYLAPETITATKTLEQNEPLPLSFTVAQTGQATWTPAFTAAGSVDISGTPAELRITTAGGTSTFNIPPDTAYTVPGLTVRGGRWHWADIGGNDAAATVDAVGHAADDVLTVTITHSYSGADAYAHIAVPATLKFAASGPAPVMPQFSVTGDDTVLTVRSGSDQTTVATLTMSEGSTYTVPGLVLCRGMWLYDGIPASVGAALSQTPGSAMLAADFREGRL